MSTSLSAEARRRRARAAALSRHHPEQAEEDRRVLKHDAMERYIREMVDRWPPLTSDQRDRLALLLQGGDGDAA
jgi:hypothetical protein